MLAAKASAALYPCEPDEATKVVIAVSSSLPDGITPWNEVKQKRAETLRKLIAENPRNLFLHREYQNMHVFQWKDRNRDVEEYRSLFEKNPADPFYLYLYGRQLSLAGLNDEALRVLEKAVQIAPDFPQVHSTLASIYSRKNNKNPAKLSEHLQPLLMLCPDSADTYTYMANIHDKPFLKQAIKSAEGTLKNRSDDQAAQIYRALWEMRFSLYPPAEHDIVRETIGQELLTLQNYRSFDWLETRKRGYVYLEDESAVTAMEDLILKLFPNTRGAAEITVELWKAKHPEPVTMDAKERKAYNQAYFQASEEWIKHWPNNTEIWVNRFTAMMDLESIDSKQLEENVDRFLNVWENNNNGYFIKPPVYFDVARLYLERNIRMPEIPSLIEKGMIEYEEQVSLSNDVSDEKTKKHLKSEYEWITWEKNMLLTEFHTQSGSFDLAAGILSEMKSFLDQKEHLQDDRSQKELRTYQGDYFKLMGELSEKQGKKLDAVSYYIKAQEKYPDLQQKANSLWRELGGSPEALATLSNAAAPEAASPKEEEVEEPLPQFALLDVNGKQWALSDLKGKVTFINVWATWCGPCRYELPLIQELHDQMKDRKDVNILTFNVDQDTGAIRPYLKKYKYTFPVLLAKDYVGRVKPDSGIPQNWIVDQNGTLRKFHVGFSPMQKDDWVKKISEQLEQLLAGKKAGS